jgi:delta 1-pyrroline-5-carboxylate dehydrogenase
LSGVEGLIHEYSLSSQEGVALMCLAEALLRIPDAATRDALIRDKISSGDWRSHVGQSPSLFVNAATWGLVVNRAFVEAANPARVALKSLPNWIASQICLVEDWHVIDNLKAVIFEGEADALIAINRDVAQRDGPILPVLSAISAADDYDLNRLLEEVSISTNTAAAGGNASLMSIG